MTASLRTGLVPWLWLGLRLAVGGGRRTAIRAALLGAGASIGIVLVMAAMAVPVVVDAQRERALERRPISAVQPDGTAGPNAAGTLQAVTIEDSVDGRPLNRVCIAGTGDRLPPGVSRLPGPGEVVLSPALTELIASNDLARLRFPQRAVGTVASAGLVAPDELLAYVGVTAQQLPPGEHAIAGFGGSISQEQLEAGLGSSVVERLLTPGRVAAFAFAFFLLAPLAVLLATCARLSASVRDQRMASLRLLGASQRQALIVNSVEMGLVAAAGVVVGALVFPPLAVLSGSLSFGRFHWFAADVHVSLVRQVIAGILIVAFAMLVGAVGAAPAIAHPLATRRQAVNPRPGRWRIFAFGGSLLAVAVGPLLAGQPSLMLILFGSGLIGIAVTLPLALANVTVYATHPLLGRSNIAPSLLLMARRLRHAPGTAPRLVASIIVAIYVGGVGMLAATSYGAFQAPEKVTDQGWLPQELNGDRKLATALRDGSNSREVAYFDTLVGHSADRTVIVMRATCSDLKVLFTQADGCQDGRAYRLQGVGDELAPGSALEPTDPLYAAITRYRVPAAILALPQALSGQGVHIVVTEAPPTGSIWAKVSSESAALEQWHAVVARMAPAAQVQGYRQVATGFDSGAVLVLVSGGLLVCVAMGLTAFAVAAVDRSVTSRRQNIGLTVIGIPQRVLRTAETGQLLSAMCIGLTMAIGMVTLVALTWAKIFGASLAAMTSAVGPLFLIVAVGLGASAVIVGAATSVLGHTTPELLRRE